VVELGRFSLDFPSELIITFTSSIIISDISIFITLLSILLSRRLILF